MSDMIKAKQEQKSKQWLWAIGLWLGGLFSCLLIAILIKMALRLIS
jgi:hypothetical protein